MKRFKLQSIALIVFFATRLASCSSDNDIPEAPKFIYKSAFATAIDGPATGKVGEELAYTISFISENGCGVFSEFTDIDYKKEPGYLIQVEYPITPCGQNTPETKRFVYKITTQAAGTYYLRVAKSETEYVVKEVVISNK